MKRLQMFNGDVTDAERCPVCGMVLSHVEERGDVTAYVHDSDGECLL